MRYIEVTLVFTPTSSRPIARRAPHRRVSVPLLDAAAPPTSRTEARPYRPCPCSAPIDILPSALPVHLPSVAP